MISNLLKFSPFEKPLLEYYIKDWLNSDQDLKLVACLVEEGAPKLTRKQIEELFWEAHQKFINQYNLSDTCENYIKQHADTITQIEEAVNEGVQRRKAKSESKE